MRSRDRCLPIRQKAKYDVGDTLDLQNGTKAKVVEVMFGWVVRFYYILDNGAYYIENYE